MNCGLTILGVYAGVCSLTIIILGSLLLSGGDCEEKSLMESCKELQVAGGVTEVRNKIVKTMGGWNSTGKLGRRVLLVLLVG